MRYFLAAMIFGTALNTGGCVDTTRPSSAQRVELDLTASCHRLEQQAYKAAHPDKEMMQTHEQWEQKAKSYSSEAQAHYSDVALRQRAIEQAAQAQIEAAAVLDWKYKLKQASDCWDELDLTREIHSEQQQRLARLADSFASQQPPQSFVDPALYTLQTTPPAAPRPIAAPLDLNYSAPKPKTWMDTPYAPMIPPVMRDQPVENINPMIPPAARNY